MPNRRELSTNDVVSASGCEPHLVEDQHISLSHKLIASVQDRLRNRRFTMLKSQRRKIRLRLKQLRREAIQSFRETIYSVTEHLIHSGIDPGPYLKAGAAKCGFRIKLIATVKRQTGEYSYANCSKKRLILLTLDFIGARVGQNSAKGLVRSVFAKKLSWLKTFDGTRALCCLMVMSANLDVDDWMSFLDDNHIQCDLRATYRLPNKSYFCTSVRQYKFKN